MADADTLEYDLEQSPGHLLHRAQQFAADRFAETMEGAAITQRQFAVLRAVAANEGLTQTDLVKATGIDRSTLAELVARMARRGLLARERAAQDARANTVKLTVSGRAALSDALPRAAAADALIMDALPKNKRAAFLDTLQRLAQVMDSPDAAVIDAGTQTASPKKAKGKDKLKNKAKGKEKPKAAKVDSIEDGAKIKTSKLKQKSDKKGKSGKKAKKD